MAQQCRSTQWQYHMQDINHNASLILVKMFHVVDYLFCWLFISQCCALIGTRFFDVYGDDKIVDGVAAYHTIV